jgi:hypothetical protein
MPASVLDGVVLNNRAPSEILPYDKNCAAMTFSRLLGIGVYATINHFITKGWIAKGTDLENDEKILAIIGHLGLKKQCKDEPWSAVKPKLSALRDGRYYGMNYGIRGSEVGDASGHAFAILKKGRRTEVVKKGEQVIAKGSWGVFGNNSEKKGKDGKPGETYLSTIRPDHLISVYGPIT